MPTTPDDLIALGMAVCEVAHPLPDGCSCRLRSECPSPGKHPVGRGWLSTAIAKRQRSTFRVPTRVRLAGQGAGANYGLIPMPGSGIVVIDRDDPDVLLPIPPTFEVHRASAPARKGHYYGVLADGIAEDDVPRVFAGGEVRVAGSGHVVGPGSRHASGDAYEANGEAVGVFDRNLIDHLSALRPVRRGAGGEVEAVEGSRHAFLVGQARAMAGWGWDAERIEDRLREMNEEYCEPPLDEKTAEFGRMAEWAAKNIAPDATFRVRKTKRAKRARRGWAQ